MRRTKRTWTVLCGAIVAVGAASVSSSVGAGPKKGTLADAQIFLEFNSTDDDLGVQVFLDAEGWKEMTIVDPDDVEIARFEAAGRLADVGGLTELRFESAEPSPEEVLDAFLEGVYAFSGTTVDGAGLVGTATLSHDLPAAPSFSPSDGEEVGIEDAVVTWHAADVAGWEVIIENEDLGAELFVRLPADVTELRIPPTFLRPKTEYDIEVLAVASNGNKTITESTFVTSK